MPLRLTRGLLVAVLAIAGAVASIAGQSVRYVYDAAGRLVAAIDPTGDAAVYNYDAVGNLLSITRHTASTITIIDFSPTLGPVGTTVTIHGTGFSSTPSSNTVEFNGTAASISAASANSLTVTVPSGATSGAISVTSPNGVATSSGSFTVASFAPAISSFTPSIAPAGAQLDITGTNFDAELIRNKAKVGVASSQLVSATSTLLEILVPTGTASGRITVSTPYGQSTTAGILYVPPPPYTAADVQWNDVLIVQQPASVALSTAGKIGLALIDVTQVQRVSVKVVPGPLGSLVIQGPDGSTLLSRSNGISPILLEPGTLSPAVYTIRIDPTGTGTGTTTLTLYDVPADATGTLTFGTTETASLGTPGQNASYPFSGTADQRVSLRVNPSAPTGTVKLLDPDGIVLGSVSSGVAAGFIDTRTLTATGTHTVFIDPLEANTGNVTVTLYDVPADLTGTITDDGTPVTTSITTPGQNGVLTFSGTSGQRVSLRVNSGAPGGTVKILDSSEATIGSANSGLAAGFMEPVTLGATGSYSVKIDPSGANTGNVTTSLYDVPDDTSGSITIGGSTVGVTLTAPGQNGSLTFSGTSGQQVTVRLTNNNMGAVRVRLLKPDGSQLTSSISSLGAFNLSTQTLPVTGTYTIVIDPSQWHTGSITVEVTNP